VKLLLDENLSPTLAETLAETYPGMAHIREFGLQSAPDPTVWAHAANHGYTIVTKDADFHHRSLLHGHPPKIIWIRLGNCSTREIAELLTTREEHVKAFLKSTEHSFLVLA
jgi:predicted nuclease of predicted toxin-antitoxin system